MVGLRVRRLVLMVLLGSLLQVQQTWAGLTLDPAFGEGGIAVLPYVPVTAGATTAVTSVVATRDGKLALAGLYPNNGFFAGLASKGFITRLDQAGQRDASFFGGTIDRLPTPVLVMQRDGRLLAGSSNGDGPLARYNDDGTLDHAFTDNAARALSEIDAQFTFVDMVVLPDARIVVLGARPAASGSPTPVLARLLQDGTLDPAFASGLELMGGTPRPSQSVVQVVRHASGALAVLVITLDGENGFNTILQLTPDGRPDASFGVAGRTDLPPSTPGVSDVGGRIAADRNGDAIVASLANNLYVPSRVVLRRLTKSGVLDPSFGQSGLAVVSGGSLQMLGALVLAADGRIVVAAGTGNVAVGIPLRRFLWNGMPDLTFGPDATLSTPLLKIFGLAFMPDGALAVAGGTITPDGPRAAVARFIGDTPAIEFYNTALDHYFITTNPLEARDLDEGVHAGWTRTGETFGAQIASGAVPSGLAPACRFYIPPAKGDSHFLSAFGTECATIEAAIGTNPNYAGYVKETSDAFRVGVPAMADGACAAGTTPVYRLWNTRADSNHRYTTRLDVRQQMLDRGYVAEGFGPDGVAMCAF